MATMPVDSNRPESRKTHSSRFDEAMQRLSRDDRFRATIYAMNTLLVQKGIYSPEEFESHFCQFAFKNLPHD